MAKLSKKDVAQLRDIVKETSGRELSDSEGYVALHYVLQLVRIVWKAREPRTRADTGQQLSLFGESSHSGDTIAHMGV
jgi:hypothetical protein